MGIFLFKMAATSMCSVFMRNVCSLRTLRQSVSPYYSALRNLSAATDSHSTDKSESSGTADGQANLEECTKKIAELEKVLAEDTEKFKNHIKETEDKYKRSLAETENVRRRMKKQVDDAKLFGIQGFCKDLLEVADVLNKATESVPQDQLTKENPHLTSLYEGLTMTNTQLVKVFARHGLEKIEPSEGDKFNPHMHEALFQVPAPGKENGTVAVVTKIGYQLHERTIRPALVGVVKS